MLAHPTTFWYPTHVAVPLTAMSSATKLKHCILLTVRTLITVISRLVLYADDILLLSSTVTELQNMLHYCERELDALDLVINVEKSCCIQIGQHINDCL